MHTSYYEVTVPILRRNLVNLRALLLKGQAFAAAQGMTEETLLASSLAPDMFPLLKQVQITTDNAKGIVARLTGTEPIVLPDTERSLDELFARIDRVIAHLDTLTPEMFEAAAKQHVTLPYYPRIYFKGSDYLREFALPNFFFHLSMCYASLRSVGTPLGKADYLGSLTSHPIEAS